MKADRSWTLFSIFISVGVALIAASWLFFKKGNPPPTLEHRIAWVDREYGEVKINRTWNSQIETVGTRNFLVPWDSVDLADASQAMLVFDDGSKFKLKSQGLVTVEVWDTQTGPQINIVIKRGDLEVMSSDPNGKFIISKNGHSLSAHLYSQSQLAGEQTESPSADKAEKPVSSALQTLDQDEISTVFSSHKTSFFKCFTQLLQKNPSAKGKLLLSVTINTAGKIQDPKLTSKILTDSQFHKCIIDVAARIHFRTFSGPNIATQLPLQFE